MQRAVKIARGPRTRGKLYLLWDNPILRQDEGRLLFICSLHGHFPARSFKEMLDRNLLPEAIRNDSLFGIGGVDIFYELPKNADIYTSPPFYLVKIDWTYTDDTLAQGFKDRLRPIRPTDCHPQRKRPGRRGLSLNLSPVDMLNQLAAFRQNRARVSSNPDAVNKALRDFEPSVPYQPGRVGFQNAVKAAENRIARMLEVPFFGPGTIN